MKVSGSNDIYDFTKYDKTQIKVTTVNENPNTGGYLLQNWGLNCNDENTSGKIQNFIKSTKTNSPTSHSGAESLPPIGDSFMCTETRSNSHCNNVFDSFERTDKFSN